MVKKVGKYELGRSLGEGTFGKVKYAVDTETNEAVAIKILDKEKIQQQNMGNQIKKEISIMKMVKHKYIVEMIEVLASKTKIFIVLELVTGGELFDKIVQVGKLSVEQARFYFLQLVEGVEYCHKLGVCHRDLKPENLLLDEHGNLKISDFGLSSLYIGDSDGETNRTQLLHTTCGTPNYVAPEVLSDQGYDGKKADVWSIGVILYVLVAGFLPFDESTIVALFAKIQNADFTYPSWFDELIRSLLDQMLVADPKARLTLSDLKQHPWCTNGNVASLGDLSTKGSKEKVDGKRDSYDLDAAFQNHHIEDEDNDDQQQHDVTVLNAFDLVSQCGGFLLNKMFSPEYFYAAINTATTRPDSARAKGAELVSSPSGKVLFGSSRFTQKSKCFHFSSSSTSPQELMGAIYDSLKEMNFDFNMSRNTIVHSGSLKGNLVTQKGMVGIFVQVFIISPYLNLVEIQKGKGDILEWSNAFNELTNKKIAHLINKSQVI